MKDNQLEGSPEAKGNTAEAHAQLRKDNYQSNGDDAIHAPMDRRASVESLFSDVSWKDETTGYIQCPGKLKHTTPAGDRDCRIKIDGVPTMSCVHTSCVEEIKSANRMLRDALSSPPSAADQKRRASAAKAKAHHEQALKVRTKKSLPSLLKTYAWPYEQIVAETPHPVAPDDREGMFRSFLGLFEEGDVVWMGEVAGTGQAHHAVNFKVKAEWLAGEVPGGPFTCPSSFVPGSISRSKENVALQRYLVVESDSLSKKDVGAIFRWLDQAVGLRLRAVVDTAGKSLHGWFEYPPPEVLADLKIMLPVMGCDPKMFGSSQPCRLPGGLREGRVQRLIYSKNGGAL